MRVQPPGHLVRSRSLLRVSIVLTDAWPLWSSPTICLDIPVPTRTPQTDAVICLELRSSLHEPSADASELTGLSHTTHLATTTTPPVAPPSIVSASACPLVSHRFTVVLVLTFAVPVSFCQCAAQQLPCSGHVAWRSRAVSSVPSLSFSECLFPAHQHGQPSRSW